ncbi:POU domain, class 6, transcription factor 2-like [Bombus pascuorum]|uniref:POU domain, class 6, transcription factor 2-like n=1 Tax=Bombus pascuorum TaxID=65598 RepID=UPI00298EADEF|nr:POU domain, class 6, transcription factor 2-like [Bombus pascuorum]
MKTTRSPPSPVIPTKNRFEVLQTQETTIPQQQNHTQATSTKESTIQNAIVEAIRKKNNEMRIKANRRTTPTLGTPHTQEKSNDTRTNSPLAPPRRPPTPQNQHTHLIKPKEQPPPTKTPMEQAQQEQPTNHPTEEQQDAPSPTKANSHTTLRALVLVESTANLRAKRTSQP